MTKAPIKHSMIIAIFILAVLSTICILNVAEANAQSSIELKFHKDFGYSSFGNDAQGNWTAQVTVSEDIMRVEFYLNNSLQYTDTEAPFSWSYTTDNYPLGLYTIKALAYNVEGYTATAEAQQNFVESTNLTLGIILAIAIIIIVASIVLVFKMKKNKHYTKR